MIVPSMFRSKTKRSASSGRSKNESSGFVVAEGWLPPAPFSRQSTRPNSRTISSAARRKPSASSTSAAKTTARPGPFKSAACASAFSRLRATSATFAPQPTSARTIACPSTPVPPVTTTARPPKSYIFVNSAKSISVSARARRRLRADEERHDVAVIEVLRDVAADYLRVRLEHVEIPPAHLGRDLVADVQELPEARVVERVLAVVAERPDVLKGSPALHFLLRGELRAVYVYDGRVRRAECVDVVERLAVNLFSQLKHFAAALGEPDYLFEPGGARGLHVYPCAGARERASYGLVYGELVAAGVDAQLEVRRQIILRDGVRDDGDVLVELLLELRHVAYVVHALVEAARELRRDGLRGYPLVGDGREYDEQLGRRLRRVGLVHRDFGDEVAPALDGSDVAVDAPRVLHGL